MQPSAGRCCPPFPARLRPQRHLPLLRWAAPLRPEAPPARSERPPSAKFCPPLLQSAWQAGGGTAGAVVPRFLVVPAGAAPRRRYPGAPATPRLLPQPLPPRRRPPRELPPPGERPQAPVPPLCFQLRPPGRCSFREEPPRAVVLRLGKKLPRLGPPLLPPPPQAPRPLRRLRRDARPGSVPCVRSPARRSGGNQGAQQAPRPGPASECSVRKRGRPRQPTASLRRRRASPALPARPGRPRRRQRQ